MHEPEVNPRLAYQYASDNEEFFTFFANGSYERKMNDRANFACEVLKRYSQEAHTLPRSTSDLSPLEQWLLCEMHKMGRNWWVPMPQSPPPRTHVLTTDGKVVKEDYWFENGGWWSEKVFPDYKVIKWMNKPKI